MHTHQARVATGLDLSARHLTSSDMGQHRYGLPDASTSSSIAEDTQQVVQQSHGPLPQGLPPQHDPGSYDVQSGYPLYHLPHAPQPGYGAPRPAYPSLQQVKIPRATKACTECRKRKTKCDETQPCRSCCANNLVCKHDAQPPEKTDKADKIMEKVTRLAEQLHADSLGLNKEVVKGLVSTDRRITQLEPARTRLIPPPPQKPSKPEGPTSRRRLNFGSHRAASHKLISLWPSVNRLLKEAGVHYNDRYVQEAENRGNIRLYGHGESGEFGEEVVEMDGTQSGGPASPAPSEDSFLDTSGPPEGTWGYGIKAYAGPNATPLSRFPCAGGLKPNGGLDLDLSTINSLWANFVQHVYVVDPIVDLATTRASIDNFVSKYSPGGLCTRPDVALFASEQGTVESTTRRKGSRAVRGNVATAHCLDTERSPENAIVYLVLALGKICTREWASYAYEDPTQHAANTKVSPGLAYYAKAAEIMGEQSEGNDLIHAQMFLLAGLYKGQLARVKESMRWVTKASAVAMILLDRYKLYSEMYWDEYAPSHEQHKKGQRPVTYQYSNLVALVSWSCLQLEVDILAEFDLAHSGILDLIDLLPIPSELTGGEIYEALARDGGWNSVGHNDIILFYTARMFLRKRLNIGQGQFYGTGCLEQTLIEVQQTFHHHESILNGWRDLLPPKLKWEENDSALTTDMLRADYWRLRHLISRPFLDYAIHIMQDVKDGRRVEDVALDAWRGSRHTADIRIFKAIELMGQGTVLTACESCVEAAMKGIDALDGVPDQVVMVNIHGVAHAQFGNMLVLSATWRTHFLRKLIDQDRFQAVLDRTIGFLSKLSSISPTCRDDCEILEKIRLFLFGGPLDQKLIVD